MQYIIYRGRLLEQPICQVLTRSHRPRPLRSATDTDFEAKRHLMLQDCTGEECESARGSCAQAPGQMHDSAVVEKDENILMPIS